MNAPLLAEVMKPLGTIAAYGSVKNMTPELPFGPFLFKALKITRMLRVGRLVKDVDNLVAASAVATGTPGVEPAATAWGAEPVHPLPGMCDAG